MLGELVIAAAAIAVVAYTDVIVTARAFAGDQRVDANREFTALGVTDVIGGIFGAYPISASSSRTAIARMNGATSRFYSWVVAVVLVLTAAAAVRPPVAPSRKHRWAGSSCTRHGPSSTEQDGAASGGCGGARWSSPTSCAVGVVVLGILPGIAIAIGLSVTELLIRLSRPHDGVLGFVPGLAGMHDVDDYPDAEQVPGLVVYRYDSPLFFANSNDFYSQCLEAADTPGCRWFVLNVEANVEVDSTGLDALVQLHDELQGRGIVLALARVKNDLMIPMRRYGVADLIGEENMYATLPTAVQAYRDVGGRASGPGCRADRPGCRPAAVSARRPRAAKVRAQPQPATTGSRLVPHCIRHIAGNGPTRFQPPSVMRVVPVM